MSKKQAGNSYIIQLESAVDSGVFNAIAHLTTNSDTNTNGLVDVTNKTDGRWRCNIQVGQRTLDLTGTVVVSDADTWEQMLNIFDNSLTWRVRVVDGKDTPRIREGLINIADISNAAEVNGAHTADFSMQSTGEVTRIQ